MKNITKALTALGLVICLGAPLNAHAEDGFIGPPGAEGEMPPPPPEFDFEKIKNMSPEERRAHHEQMRERFKNMSEEERAAHRQKMREHFESLPPEEQERIREMRAKHHKKGGGLRGLGPEDMDAMKDMTPEERKAYVAQKREKFKNMSEEERAAHREEMRARFENMSDEEREALMKHRKHGGKHNRQGGPGAPPPPRDAE